MAKYKSKTKQNYRKKSKGNGKKRRKSMKKRGGNGNDIFIKFLPDDKHESLTGYSATTSDSDKIIAHLYLGEGDESKKVGDLRQFRCETSKYIYLYLFDHNDEATELGDGSGCNYKFLNYNADTADLSKFLKLIYYPKTDKTGETKLTLSKIDSKDPDDSTNPNKIELDDNTKAELIYEIISNVNNVGYIIRCTDDTYVTDEHREKNDFRNQIKHDIAMINLTEVVPQEKEPEPQNWFYRPSDDQAPECSSKQYRIPVPLKQGTGICLLSGKHTYREVKIFTKHF